MFSLWDTIKIINQISRFLFVIIIICFVFVYLGCKNDKGTSVTVPETSNTFSFNTDEGNFSATGIYNPNATSGSGVGWYDEKTLAAYNIISSDNGSITLIMFNEQLSERTYSLATEAIFTWAFNFNLNDSSLAEKQCISKGGNVIISSYKSTDVKGTFSGHGCYMKDIIHTINFTDGAFSLTSASPKRFAVNIPENVEKIVKRMIEWTKQN